MTEQNTQPFDPRLQSKGANHINPSMAAGKRPNPVKRNLFSRQDLSLTLICKMAINQFSEQTFIASGTELSRERWWKIESRL